MARRVTAARFIGRRDELTVLERLRESVRTGRGAVSLVSGEAGVGKSRFLAQVAEGAEHEGFRVLRGWCLEHGDEVMPLAPLVDLLRNVIGGTSPSLLSDVLGPAKDLLRSTPAGPFGEPDLSPTEPTSIGRLFEATLRVLRRLSQDQPLLVAVEDVHWADASTRELLTFLAPRVADRPVRTAGTALALRSRR